MKESWKKIRGFSDYEVSDKGRVRSLDREVSTFGKGGVPVVRKMKGKMLSPSRTASAVGTIYLRVCLSVNGVVTTKLVHQLVAEAFIPKRNREHTVVLHRDDDGENNHKKNLKWGSQADNISDMTRKGRHAHGEQASYSTITEAQAKKVIALLKKGNRVADVAGKVGTTHGVVYHIRRGTTWTHLER